MTIYLVTSDGRYYIHGVFTDRNTAEDVASILSGSVRAMHINQLYDIQDVKLIEEIKLLELGFTTQ